VLNVAVRNVYSGFWFRAARKKAIAIYKFIDRFHDDTTWSRFVRHYLNEADVLRIKQNNLEDDAEAKYQSILRILRKQGPGNYSHVYGE